ncbi:hypothetical protein FRB94_012060 [Tulasnella sp. JGI-2019a]|nr:hypothetical protein FRB94_012060 [Tulasnella sp. JGI-2019a]
MSKSAIPGIIPDDLWVEVYHYLEVVYIVRSARVCRYLNDLLKLRTIWINAISSQIQGEGLALPGRNLGIPLADYDAETLKEMTIRATKLTLNLAYPNPKPTAELDSHVEKSHITHVFLISDGQGADWVLVSVAATTISCWEVLKDPLQLLPAGSWNSGDAFIIEVARDTTQTTPCMLCVSIKEPRAEVYKTLIIRVTDLQLRGIPKFEVLQTLENHFVGLIRGDYVGAWRARRKVATITNWRTSEKRQYRLLPEDHPMAGLDTFEQGCTMELISTSLVIITTNFRAVWDITEAHTTQPSLPSFLQRTSYNETRLASLVPLPLTCRLLDSLPGKDLATAAFLALTRTKTATGSETALFEVFIQRRDAETEWEIHAVDRGSTSATSLSPYVQGVLLGSSGRGVVMDTVTVPRGDVWDSLPRLILFDIVPRDLHVGVPPAIDSWSFSISPGSTESVLGLLKSKEEVPLKTTCLDYDDSQGRIAVATSDGRLRIIEYV